MNIYEILRLTPRHDTVTLRFERPDLPGHIDEVTVTEEELRWLQLNIARGNYPSGKVCIIKKNGEKVYFNSDGRLMAPCGNNCLSYNDDLAMKMLKAKAGL